MTTGKALLHKRNKGEFLLGKKCYKIQLKILKHHLQQIETRVFRFQKPGLCITYFWSGILESCNLTNLMLALYLDL
jgi:hypothetical protein